mmetsp:Transcript_77878/g.202914  ORF Transcript_77878/g.202914 Transcript_77878/m.202914 type:complete len:213 (+) Transcript_77878:682-1320(+)
MASNALTTSVARIRAALTASDLVPPLSAALHRCRVPTAVERMSTPRSSRPFRRWFATELRCAMHLTRRRCSSTYSGSCWRSSRLLPLAPLPLSRRRSACSCCMACTTSLRAFSSMSMSSRMYFSSKLAQAASNLLIASCKSDLLTARPSVFPQFFSTASRSLHFCCRTSALCMASWEKTNFSPLTQMTACCSTLASKTSTRYVRDSSGNSAR